MDARPADQVASATGVASAHAAADVGGSQMATPELLLEGFRRALGRFRNSLALGDVAPVETFVPLFETLTWLVAARVENDLRGHPEAEMARAIRFARHRVGRRWADAFVLDDVPRPTTGPVVTAHSRLIAPPGHHWADALDPDVVPYPTAAQIAADRSRLISPRVVKGWCWRATNELPGPKPSRHKNSKCESLYRTHLAGRPALLALEAVAAALETVKPIIPDR